MENVETKLSDEFYDLPIKMVDEYVSYIRFIVNKAHVMRLIQLKQILQKKFNLSEDLCRDLVIHAQKENYILVSADEYVMTQGYYLMNTEDKFFDGLNRRNWTNFIEFPMQEMVKRDIGTIKCMTVVANMMPVSENFIIPQGPWNITFYVPEEYIGYDENTGNEYESNIYELIYIPHKSSTTLCNYLRQFQFDDEETRNIVKRIAILENPDDDVKVPYIGFTNIITEKYGNYKLISHRENPWDEEEEED